MVSAKTEYARGRSAALSAAWLQASFDGDREAHQKLKKELCSEDSWPLRTSVRDELKQSIDHGIQYILEEVERPPYDDEDEEPKHHPYRGR